MSASVTIHIPLKPYLHKFLVKKYGTAFVANHKTSLGLFVRELIDTQYRRQGHIKNGVLFSVIIPKNMVNTIGFSFPPDKFAVFEKWVVRIFKEQLFEHVRITLESKLYKDLYGRLKKEVERDHHNGTIKTISQFLRSYDITEDELKLDSIYREYTRFISVNRTI